MIVNIEITTYCNFNCVYCYTSQYPNKFMDMNTFKEIVDLYINDIEVHEFRLNGEGEPLLHPRFWDMVYYIKQHSSHHLITFITNGSTLSENNRQLIAQHITKIFVSIDTTDTQLSTEMGRPNINKVIDNITALINIGYTNIVLMSVDYGQDMNLVKELSVRLNLPWFYQLLQSKTDYKSNYPNDLIPEIPSNKNISLCPFLTHPVMRFHTIDKVVLPCCTIKDVTHYTGIPNLIQSIKNGIAPKPCEGCRLLYSK